MGKQEENGNMRCPLCGGELCWGGDNMAYEVSMFYEEDDAAIASNYTCMKCGRFFEIYDPPKEDREGAYKDFWAVP